MVNRDKPKNWPDPVPHYYQADGRREVFVRNGDRSEQASTEHLNDLILKGTHQTWDTLDSGIPVDRGSFSVFEILICLSYGEEYGRLGSCFFWVTYC